MKPNDFWPFVESARCIRCGEPVPTREAVAVTASDPFRGEMFDGFAHDWQCVQ